MSNCLPKILLTFRIGGENGGPYTSHKRILSSSLNEKYDIKPFMIENPRKLRHPRLFIHTVKYLKKEKPDIVHMAGLGSEGFLVMLACRLAKVKSIVAVRGSSTEATGFGYLAHCIFRIIERYTVKKANMVYGVSNYVSSWKICKNLKNYYGTVYNIPCFMSSDNKPYVRNELGIAPDDIVVTSTGRIVKDKGFDTLLEVIKRTHCCNKIKFIIAGDGCYRAEMETELKKYKIDNTVFMLGYRNDVEAILKESDIFVICTKHETLCNSLLEAASNSLPLVASNVGGIPEIISNGKNGYLIEPFDVDGFVSAIEKLAGNVKLRKRMGASAKLQIEDKFNVDKIVMELDQIYRSVLGS